MIKTLRHSFRFPSSALRPLFMAPLAAAWLAAPLAAQTSTRADSARRDSSGTITRLLPVTVNVTRTATPLARAPWAVGSVDGGELRRGRATIGLDEALSEVPGVYVANRYNFSLDQRISIRGFGSRSNFGVRGLTLLLDGVPQTLPDGQGQLTNIDLANVSRIDVLRGSASSLYGNGSGGVLSFTTDMSAPEPLQATGRVEGGAFGLRKWQARASGRAGNTVASLAASRLTIDGFRQHSAAEQRTLTLGVDHQLSPATVAQLRFHAANLPLAENPGALTFAEYARTRDSAAANNVLRGANKWVSQQQLSLSVRHAGDDGSAAEATVFGTLRDLTNPLAAPPPGTASPLTGTFNTIGRGAGGLRLSASRRVGDWGARTPLLTAGLDAQSMRDHRRNSRATAGRIQRPTDTLFLDQVETVTNVAPFGQVTWEPAARWQLELGGRYDRVRFNGDDRFLKDRADNGGARVMAAFSGHAGASWQTSPRFTPYVNAATSFETPTTTELQARSDGNGGFNDALGPQRALSLEAGARGAAGRVTYQASVFRVRVNDALVQFLETSGRAFFRNVGRTGQSGAELGGTLRLFPAVDATASYTYAHYRFDNYRAQSGTRVDTLDGKWLPGVPAHFLRTGLRTRLGAGATLDVDHTISTKLYADDRNTLRVPGWGRGNLDARLAWGGRVGGVAVQPFVSVTNAFGQRYVGAVTVNGAAGRVLEPAPGRGWFAGMQLGGL
jgi:iron complex outermembrane receptor protein